MMTTIAAIAALWFTGESLRATKDQYGLSQQIAVTDRFEKAVVQLASDTVDTRIAGVYLLERLANDSPTDSKVVYAILSAFVRNHTNASECAHQTPQGPIARVPPDIQAAMDAVSQRRAELLYERLDLREVCIAYLNLHHGSLSHADLSKADLTGAILDRVNMLGAVCQSANFSDTIQASVILTHANLIGANFTNAVLTSPGFENAKLQNANFSHTTLYQPWFIGANLSGANFENATLKGANFTDIYYDSTTLWPAGFTPPVSRPAP